MAHHSSVRRQRGPSPTDRACAARYSTQSSPASHLISNFAVRMTCVDSPVSWFTFMEKSVRVLVWKGAGRGRTFGEGRGVFMPSIVFFRPFAVIPQRSQFLGARANAVASGANHG